MIHRLFSSILPKLAAGVALAVVVAVVPASPAFAPPAPSPNGQWTVVAAGARTAVFAVTTGNNTTRDNGTYFYNAANLSRGFAPTSTISLGSADVEDPPRDGCGGGNGNFRLSWHHSFGMGDPDEDPFHLMFGYRAGCDELNASSEPRAVYQSDSPASLYFSGPAIAVPHDDLLANGWSVCFSGLYNESGGDPESNCTGTYILLAGGGDAVAPLVSSSSSSSSSSAEVEAGPPGIALTVPNALGRDSAGLPIYFGSNNTSSYGGYSLELTGPQGRTVLASGKSSVYGGYVGMVRLPAGLPGGSYVLSLKNTSAAGIPLVLKVNLTLDASSRLQSHSPG